MWQRAPGPRLLVVQHQADCPPALFGDWLDAAGVSMDVRRPDRGDPLPLDLAGHDGLLVLGGSMGAHDDRAHPWLPLTRGLLRHAVEAERPTLGICLGHQLAAVALGGTSLRNPRGQTAGVRPIGWCADVTGDPLFGSLGLPTHDVGAHDVGDSTSSMGVTDSVVPHWNSDIVTVVPERASVLATTDDGAPQVLRLGERAWGVQFHPEVEHTVVSAWLEEHRHSAGTEGPDLDEALRQLKAADVCVRATGRRIADAFARVLSGHRR